jgi:hypothetical protein
MSNDDVRADIWAYSTLLAGFESGDLGRSCRLCEKQLARLGSFYNHLATLLNTGSMSDVRGNLAVFVTGGPWMPEKTLVTVMSHDEMQASAPAAITGADLGGAEDEGTVSRNLFVSRNAKSNIRTEAAYDFYTVEPVAGRTIEEIMDDAQVHSHVCIVLLRLMELLQYKIIRIPNYFRYHWIPPGYLFHPEDVHPDERTNGSILLPVL